MIRSILAGCMLASIAGCAATEPQAAAPSPTVQASPSPQPTGAARLPANADRARLATSAPEPPGPGTPLGPHSNVTVMAAPGLLSHTIYYPADVASFPPGEKLPVLVWGNGGCRNDGRAFLGTLTKIASHGYLVVSGGVYEQRPGLEPLRGTDLIAGIDWAERANTADGPLKGRIDTSKVAAMGQSCGGLMVIEAAHDPRLDTIGVINSGMLNDLAGATLTTATKETLRTYHTPALYLNGGENDAAYVNANDDFERIDNVPVFYGVMTGAGHIATHRHRNGGVFAEVMTAWLDWRLKGDATAGRMFSGPDCGLCRNPAWVVRRKGAL